MLKDKVEALIQEALKADENLFLISFEIKPSNTIEVIIDGDKGVSVEDCIAMSRAIEHNLDRDEEDFALQVMSAGITEGLVHKRQYAKNIGRTIAVKTANDKIEGELTETSETGFTLQWKAREPKPIGKGKVTVSKEQNIAYEDVLKANVVVKFN